MKPINDFEYEEYISKNMLLELVYQLRGLAANDKETALAFNYIAVIIKYLPTIWAKRPTLQIKTEGFTIEPE